MNLSQDNYRRIWLPYCVRKMEDKVGGWIVLNRGYKPLGQRLCYWFVYEDVPAYQRIKRISLSKQKKIDHGCRASASWRPNDMIWLYHDGCIPTYSPSNWKAYADRLSVLSSLESLCS